MPTPPSRPVVIGGPCQGIDGRTTDTGLTTRTLSAVSIDEQPGEAARTFGAFAVIIGLLITAFGFLTDGVPVRGYYFAGLLVFVGAAVRVEAAIRYRHGAVEADQRS
jgi:hypothetical protein